jgi:hypothetical protein
VEPFDHARQQVQRVPAPAKPEHREAQQNSVAINVHISNYNELRSSLKCARPHFSRKPAKQIEAGKKGFRGLGKS